MVMIFIAISPLHFHSLVIIPADCIKLKLEANIDYFISKYLIQKDILIDQNKHFLAETVFISHQSQRKSGPPQTQTNSRYSFM